MSGRTDTAENATVNHSQVKAAIGSIVHLDKERLLSGARSSDIRSLLEERGGYVSEEPFG